jgi:hypothetical protein
MQIGIHGAGAMGRVVEHSEAVVLATRRLIGS